MLDGIPTSGANAARQTWRHRVQNGLNGCLATLALALTRGKPVGSIQFDLVKASPRSVAVKIVVEGEAKFLKLFDGRAADQLFKSERDLLVMLRGSGVLPKIFAFSETHRFVVTEWAMETFDDLVLDRWGPMGFGLRLGDWLARYDAAAPYEPARGTWDDYVRETPMAPFVDKIPGARDVLSQIPLCGMGLSHNDAALHNFLVDHDHNMSRADFEMAGFRPRGWDYIFAQHAVMQRFPEECAEILDVCRSRSRQPTKAP